MSFTDESTPLLQSNHRPALPFLSSTLHQLRTAQVDRIQPEDLRPDGLTGDALQLAFSLIVLLQLRRTKLSPKPSAAVYDQWLQTTADIADARTLEEKIISMWTSFLVEYRTTQDIETVLWTQFPISEGAYMSLRVLDFLCEEDCPNTLLLHPVIVPSITRTWRNGCPFASEIATTNGIWKRYDAFSTPRAVHFWELVSLLSYLMLLVHYLLYPPERPHIYNQEVRYIGPRELFLILFSVSFLCKNWSLSGVIHGLVPIAFVSSSGPVPFPGEVSFDLLLWSFALHLLRIHVPSSPSPLFLLPAEYSLPFPIFISIQLRRTFSPVALYFLPVFLLISILLSSSVNDVLFHTSQTIRIPPMETRIMLLYLFFSVFLLGLTSFFLLAIALPSMPTHEVTSWNRYSTVVGSKARVAFIKTVASYAERYTFFAPLNMVPLLLVWMPRQVFGMLHIPCTGSHMVELLLWRIFIGPFTLLYGLIASIADRNTRRPRVQSSETENYTVAQPSESVTASAAM